MARNLPKFPTKEEQESMFRAPQELSSKWARARVQAHAHARRADSLAQELAEAEKALDPALVPTKMEQERAAFETRRVAPGSLMNRQPEPYSEAAAIVAKVNAYATSTRQLTRLREQLEEAERRYASELSAANAFDADLQREAAVAALNAKAQEAKEAALRMEYAPRVSDSRELNSPESGSHGSNSYVPAFLRGDHTQVR